MRNHLHKISSGPLENDLVFVSLPWSLGGGAVQIRLSSSVQGR